VSWGGTAVNAVNGGVVRSFKNNDIRDTNNDNVGILSSLAYH
jgi:hypothetical protein